MRGAVNPSDRFPKDFFVIDDVGNVDFHTCCKFSAKIQHNLQITKYLVIKIRVLVTFFNSAVKKS